MLTGTFLTLGAALSGSVGYIAIKRGLQTTDYKVFVLLSTFMGVVISGVALWISGKGLGGLSFKAIYPFLLTGGLGGGLLGRIAITKATHGIGASRTHALTSISPLVTAFFGITLLQETINLQLGLGMLVVVAGASILSYIVYRDEPGDQKEIERPLLGLGFAFYGTVLFGLHPVLRRIGLNYGATPLQGSFIRFTTGFLIYLLYLLFSRTKVKLEIGRKMNSYALAGLAWALAPLFSIYAVDYIPPTVFASLARVGPLFTVILTYFFLKGIEKTTWKTGLNALLIVVGAILVSTA